MSNTPATEATRKLTWEMEDHRRVCSARSMPAATTRPWPGSSGHTLSGVRSVPQRERLLGNRRRLARRRSGRGLGLELKWIEELG